MESFCFRTRTQVKASTTSASRPSPVYRYGKRSLTYPIKDSSFVWNVRYTMLIIEITYLQYINSLLVHTFHDQLLFYFLAKNPNLLCVRQKLEKMLSHTLSLNLNDYLINCIYRQLNNYTVQNPFKCHGKKSSVYITSNVVSSNPAQGRCIRYNIMW